jgi:tartrate-resistant acid phosphatase type 5
MRPLSVRTAMLVAVVAATVLSVLPGAAAAAKSPLRAAANAGPGVVAVIGDFGSGAPAEAKVAAMVARSRADAVVSVGDNVYYGRGYRALVGAYYPRWVARHQFFPATGNHDYAEGIRAFDQYFTWLGGRRTYETTVDGIAFFILDSQGALDSPVEMTRQRSWLRRALTASPARWKVVVLHHPPYSSGTVHGSTAQFRWPFAAWGANLVVAGHEHNYERLVEGRVTYVVDGTGGKDLYGLGVPLPGSVARDAGDYGALLLTPGATALEGRFVTASGRVVDRFSVTR